MRRLSGRARVLRRAEYAVQSADRSSFDSAKDALPLVGKGKHDVVLELALA